MAGKMLFSYKRLQSYFAVVVTAFLLSRVQASGDAWISWFSVEDNTIKFDSNSGQRMLDAFWDPLVLFPLQEFALAHVVRALVNVGQVVNGNTFAVSLLVAFMLCPAAVLLVECRRYVRNYTMNVLFEQPPWLLHYSPTKFKYNSPRLQFLRHLYNVNLLHWCFVIFTALAVFKAFEPEWSVRFTRKFKKGAVRYWRRVIGLPTHRSGGKRHNHKSKDV